jgi:hypothetical protein
MTQNQLYNRVAGQIARVPRAKVFSGPKIAWQWFRPALPKGVDSFSWIIRPCPPDPEKAPNVIISKVFHTTKETTEGYQGAEKTLKILCPRIYNKACPFCDTFDQIDEEIADIQEQGGTASKEQKDLWLALKPEVYNVLPVVFPMQEPDRTLLGVETDSPIWIWSVSQQVLLDQLLNLISANPLLFDPVNGRNLTLVRNVNKYQLQVAPAPTPFPADIDLSLVPPLHTWGVKKNVVPDARLAYLFNDVIKDIGVASEGAADEADVNAILGELNL